MLLEGRGLQCRHEEMKLEFKIKFQVPDTMSTRPAIPLSCAMGFILLTSQLEWQIGEVLWFPGAPPLLSAELGCRLQPA